jgi:uncharacterized protein (TIGR02466 family)
MTPQIIPIFPAAIYRINLRKLSTSERTAFDTNTITAVSRQGNQTSVKSSLLDDIEFTDLKTEFMEHVHNYAREVIKTDCQFYMTNSWKNQNKKGQPHDLHNHKNSVISGVYYVNVGNSENSICFNRLASPFFMEFQCSERTPFNSVEWSIPVEDAMLILFPSSLYHSVPVNTTNNERLSISFNTFIKGNFNNDTLVINA